METTSDNYAAIRAKLPRKTEVTLWTDKKVVAFLLFFERFVEEGRIRCTVERRVQMEKDMVDHEFWEEFMARIDVPTDGSTTANPVFTQRLITFSRIVLSYLKSTPNAITKDMEPIMERNPRCHWALTFFRMQKGQMGVETVQGADLDTTNPHDTKLISAKRPEVMFNDALIRTTSILKELTKGISKKQIDRMSTEDRLKYTIPLLKAVGGLVRKYVPNKQVFQQININSSKRAELEKSFLTYAEQSMQDNEE